MVTIAKQLVGLERLERRVVDIEQVEISCRKRWANWMGTEMATIHGDLWSDILKDSFVGHEVYRAVQGSPTAAGSRTQNQGTSTHIPGEAATAAASTTTATLSGWIGTYLWYWSDSSY